MPDQKPPTMTPELFAETATRLEHQIARAIVGQADIIQHTLIAIIAGGHVLLEGVPGLGKTSLVRAFADALDLRFSPHPVHARPDAGRHRRHRHPRGDSDSGKRDFRFQAGPVFANLVLADEINRATPKTQSALLEAMQERTVTVLGRTYRVEPPFFVLATQNPIEMEGTYPLPEAQLDRFLFKLNVTFPTTEELTAIIEQTTGDHATRADRVTDGKMLLAMGNFSRQVPAATQVTRYAAAMVAATHPDHPGVPDMVKSYVRFGSSPRGAQALLLGARSLALLNGRFNVAIDDLRALAPAALRHRVLLNFEGQAESIRTDDIINAVIQSLRVQ